MALQFKLNNILVNVQTNASFIETLDETLDSGSVTLEYNNNKNAIAPMTPFSIINTETNEQLDFFVIVDEVEVVKKSNPALYSHKLTFTQNTHKLTKVVIRNSTFAQSVVQSSKATCNFMCGARTWAEYSQGSPVEVFVYPKSDDTNVVMAINKAGGSPGTTTDGSPALCNPFFQFDTKRTIGKVVFSNDSLLVSFKQVSAELDNFNNPKYLENRLTKIRYTINKYTLANGVMTQTDTTLSKLIEIESVGDLEFTLSELFPNASATFFTDRTNATYYRLFPEHIEMLKPTAPNIPVVAGYPVLNRPTFSIIGNVQSSLTFEENNLSLYDVLNDLRTLALKNYNGENSIDSTLIFSMPDANTEDYNTLKNTAAPNFTFTQCDLYTCVSQVLNYIDAVPTIDSNNKLGIEYFNDNSKTRTNNNTLKFSDISSNLRDEYYINKLGSIFQQARKEKPIHYPSTKTMRKCTTKNFGIPSADDYILQVNDPIDYVDKLYFNCDATFTDLNLEFWNERDSSDPVTWQSVYLAYTYNDINLIPSNKVDVSKCLYEEKEYATLPVCLWSVAFPNTNATLKYAQGGNYIDLMGETKDAGGYDLEIYKPVLKWSIAFAVGAMSVSFSNSLYQQYGLVNNYTHTFRDKYSRTSTDTKDEIRYQVEYHPLFDGKAVIECGTKKYNGEIISSQTNGNVQLSRLGINMQGLLSKLGNEEKQATIEIKSFNDRIKKGTIYIDTDGSKYIANSVKTTFGTKSNTLITEISFIKNYNELSRYTSVDQAKRFYEIDSTLTSTGYETIVEYLYFSTTAHQDQNNTAMKSELAKSIVFGTLFGDSKEFPTIVELECINENNSLNLAFESGLVGNSYPAKALCDVNSYGFGNMICYQVGFNDAVNISNITTTKDNKLYTQPILYCSNSGYGDKYTLKFYSKADDFYNYYPLGTITETLVNPALITINEFQYQKKPNEIFKLNYEVACMPYGNEEIFFGEKFIVNNSTLRADNFIPTLKAYYSNNDSDAYSIIDKDAHGTLDNTATITKAVAGDSVVINFSGQKTFKNWCIADDNGKIYLCGNFATSQTTNSLSIYFSMARNRI